MIRPIGTRVLIEITIAEKVSAGGIIIPEVAQTFSQVAEVLSVGLDVTKVKPGDNIIFLRYGGSDIVLDGRKYRLMDETDVLGVIENGE